MDNTFSINPKLDKSITIEQLEGWNPLVVLYSVEWTLTTSYLCWKVQGTEHIFRILCGLVYENHGLDYKSHFILTLQTFREDYLEWKKQEFKEDWMKNYKQQYQTLIRL